MAPAPRERVRHRELESGKQHPRAERRDAPRLADDQREPQSDLDPRENARDPALEVAAEQLIATDRRDDRRLARADLWDPRREQDRAHEDLRSESQARDRLRHHPSERTCILIPRAARTSRLNYRQLRPAGGHPESDSSGARMDLEVAKETLEMCADRPP